MKGIATDKGYKALLLDIKQRVRKAQYEALKAVNKELISLYLDIGRMINDQQNKQGWGKSIVRNLAKDLQIEFPGMQGFSERNIWYMRNLYMAYIRSPKLQPLVAEIGWTHNIVVLENCKSDLEKEFYMRMVRKFGWTKNVLVHQIKNRAYEKTLLNQTNFKKTLPEKIHHQAKLAVKDEYTFDFLDLAEEHSELELERALIEKVNRFLLEMGGIFSFLGNQFRLEIGHQEFFIDILLYHRRLKCLVAIELKIGEFKPEYAGKMQFYLTALDELVKMRGENPSIGIILCRDKDRTVVEYALRESKKPIGVATYKMTTKLPKEFKGELPSPDQVAHLMKEI